MPWTYPFALKVITRLPNAVFFFTYMDVRFFCWSYRDNNKYVFWYLKHEKRLNSVSCVVWYVQIKVVGTLTTKMVSFHGDTAQWDAYLPIYLSDLVNLDFVISFIHSYQWWMEFKSSIDFVKEKSLDTQTDSLCLPLVCFLGFPRLVFLQTWIIF